MVFDISPHLEAHLLYQEHFSFLLDTNVSVLLQPRLFDKLVSCTGSGIYYHYVSFYSIWGCECVALIKKKKKYPNKNFPQSKELHLWSLFLSWSSKSLGTDKYLFQQLYCKPKCFRLGSSIIFQSIFILSIISSTVLNAHWNLREQLLI